MRVTNELESLYLILTIRLFGSSIIILIEYLLYLLTYEFLLF